MASGGQDDKSLEAKKAFEALGGAELIAAAVETLNPPAPGAQDWVLSDFSPDGVADTLLFEVSKSLGLQTGNSDLEQTLITTVSYVAMAEFAQHALGIGSGFVKMDFQGKKTSIEVVLGWSILFTPRYCNCPDQPQAGYPDTRCGSSFEGTSGKCQKFFWTGLKALRVISIKYHCLGNFNIFYIEMETLISVWRK